MHLHAFDIDIVFAYFAVVLTLGFWASRRSARDLDAYFLGGKALPWYLLGVSDASGMFDISGTMWLVYVLFLYGLKSVWLPWVWPTFNQVFLMMFMSSWLRRSNVLTGAEWIATRFGRGRGGTLAHLSVVFFALVNVIGLLAYAFKGIGKFAVVILPWRISHLASGPFSDENCYALILLGLTSLYAIKGGMVSVVVTEVTQFAILTVAALTMGGIAISQVSPSMIEHNIPPGWLNPFFGWKLGLDWTGILDSANDALRGDGNEMFSIIFGLMFFKGVLASLAGPAPNYDMQRILATRSPREASLMNGMVNVVLLFPRYMMVTAITVLALAFTMPQLVAMPKPDFEKILPIVLSERVPSGLRGLLLAGLASAFMSNFAATLNAAPAYVVNDLYKRFVNAHSGGRREVTLSRFVSLAFLAVGVLCGMMTDRITSVMMWLVGSLYGGFVVANVLKWYWWRFNGHGYFWGMVSGVGGALVMGVPGVTEAIFGSSVNLLYTFPLLFVVSLVGSLAGTLATPPEDTEVLLAFYTTVRPWGFWRPVREAALRRDPSFVPNTDMARDLSNVAVGIVWQTCLVVLPIYIVLQRAGESLAVGGALAATSLYLKLRWYDHLPPSDAGARASKPALAARPHTELPRS